MDFKNTVIIMTSNFAGQQIQELSDSSGADWEIEAHVKGALKSYFKPEFLNRIDETIIFHTLKHEHLEKIVEIQLAYLKQRLKDRHLDVTFTDAAKQQLMDEGYDPAYGARPLKRVIQQRLENPLATEILAGKFNEGDAVNIDTDGRAFVFEKG